MLVISIVYQKPLFVHINRSSGFHAYKDLVSTMLCNNCNNPVSLLSSNFCSNCGAFLASPPPTTPAEPSQIAWEENNQRYSATGVTLLKTLRAVLFHPNRFFSLIAKQKQRTGPAWAFALIIGGAGLLASWFWSVLLLRYAGTASGTWLFSGNAVSAATLLAAPMLISLEMLLLSFYIIFVMHLTRAKHVPFSQLFRTLCYTEAAMVIQIIPILGTTIASAVWLYSLLTALHKLYAVNRLKLFFLLLLPLFLLGLLFVILLVALLAGVILTGGSSLSNWLSQLPL